MSQDISKYSLNIPRARAAAAFKGLTQAQIALEMPVSPATVSKWFSGSTKVWSYRNRKRLSEVLGVAESYLFNEE